MTSSEARVIALLSEAGAAFAGIAPSQNALDEFNNRLARIREDIPAICQQTNGNGQEPPKAPPAKPRVFLGMPRHAGQEAETAQAAYVNASNDRCLATICPTVGSALPNSFNFLF